MPIEAQAIEEKSGYRVTSVATEVINDDTVAFFGTSNGNLRKVNVAEAAAWILCENSIAKQKKILQWNKVSMSKYYSISVFNTLSLLF